MRVEFDLRESFNAHAPGEPIELHGRLRVVSVVFDLRASLNTDAPDGPIMLLPILSVVRVEFDLRESLNAFYRYQDGVLINNKCL